MPRASAVAMFPAPMKPSFMQMKLAGRRLALVEEALLDQPGALFGRDLDVARSEQEDLVGDALHAAFELGKMPFLGRVVVLLGEAEVDKRSMPGVAERHRVRFSSVTDGFLRMRKLPTYE